MSLVLTLPRRCDYQVVPWGELRNPTPAPARWSGEVCPIWPMITLIPPIVLMLTGHPALALAYAKGEIIAKAQPILSVLQDASVPVAEGMFVWSLIRYMLGQRGEAMQMLKGTAWGLIGIQTMPWVIGIIRSIGA